MRKEGVKNTMQTKEIKGFFKSRIFIGIIIIIFCVSILFTLLTIHDVTVNNILERETKQEFIDLYGEYYDEIIKINLTRDYSITGDKTLKNIRFAYFDIEITAIKNVSGKEHLIKEQWACFNYYKLKIDLAINIYLIDCDFAKVEKRIKI